MSGEGAMQKLCCTLPHATLWLICCIVSHCDVAARLSADCYASKKHHRSKICKTLKLQICDCPNSEQCNGRQNPSDTHFTSSVCCRWYPLNLIIRLSNYQISDDLRENATNMPSHPFHLARRICVIGVEQHVPLKFPNNNPSCSWKLSSCQTTSSRPLSEVKWSPEMSSQVTAVGPAKPTWIFSWVSINTYQNLSKHIKTCQNLKSLDFKLTSFGLSK